MEEMISDNLSIMHLSFLKSEKVILRPLTETDTNGNYPNWFNDADVCKGNSHHVYPYTKEQALNYIRSLSSNKNMLVLAIIEKSSNSHIGNVSLQDINFINRCAELAIIIGEKSFWGKGIGREAVQLLMEHGFNSLNLNRIWSGTLETNIGFQKLALSMGMKHEGTRRKAIFKNGAYLDVFEYGILRDEFEQINLKAVL